MSKSRRCCCKCPCDCPNCPGGKAACCYEIKYYEVDRWKTLRVTQDDPQGKPCSFFGEDDQDRLWTLSFEPTNVSVVQGPLGTFVGDMPADCCKVTDFPIPEQGYTPPTPPPDWQTMTDAEWNTFTDPQWDTFEAQELDTRIVYITDKRDCWVLNCCCFTYSISGLVGDSPSNCGYPFNIEDPRTVPSAGGWCVGGQTPVNLGCSSELGTQLSKIGYEPTHIWLDWSLSAGTYTFTFRFGNGLFTGTASEQDVTNAGGICKYLSQSLNLTFSSLVSTDPKFWQLNYAGATVTITSAPYPGQCYGEECACDTNFNYNCGPVGGGVPWYTWPNSCELSINIDYVLETVLCPPAGLYTCYLNMINGTECEEFAHCTYVSSWIYRGELGGIHYWGQFTIIPNDGGVLNQTSNIRWECVWNTSPTQNPDIIPGTFACDMCWNFTDGATGTFCTGNVGININGVHTGYPRWSSTTGFTCPTGTGASRNWCSNCTPTSGLPADATVSVNFG